MKLALRKRIQKLAERHLEVAENFDSDPKNGAEEMETSAALLQSACYGFMLVEADKGMALMKKMMKASGMGFGPGSNPFVERDAGTIGMNEDEQEEVESRAELYDSLGKISKYVAQGELTDAHDMLTKLIEKYTANVVLAHMPASLKQALDIK